ncbi:protein takeout-like [Tribolium madens]|uniref:protein takeout-like n=1 Tax=Tribolium madens TaxID=41895 RepID=UPI001CF727E3|nr:protein takeout-like [Tribolium madens]
MKRLILLLCFAFCENVKLPPNFQKCNRNQPDLNQCLLQAAQNGISQLTRAYEKVNIPNLNPFEVPEVTVGQGSGTVAVDQNFKNCLFSGFHKMKLDQFEFDFDKKILHFVGTFPDITKKCDYELDGKVLLLPIRGSGKSTIVLENLDVDLVFHFEEYKKNDKTFIKITSNELKLEPGHVTFNFDNLFDGDKRLGDNINHVLNDNWKEVFDDVKAGYIEVISQILMTLFTNFFAKVSLEEALD